MVEINKYDYYCPKCDQRLNEKKYVVFSVQRNNNEKLKIYLNPKPGSYDFKCEPEVVFDKGEIVDFHCTNCDASLESDKYSKFVQIKLKITDGVFIDVFFSRIYGDYKTYVGLEDFEEEYGSKLK